MWYELLTRKRTTKNRQDKRPAGRQSTRTRRFSMEPLEDRRLLAIDTLSALTTNAALVYGQTNHVETSVSIKLADGTAGAAVGDGKVQFFDGATALGDAVAADTTGKFVLDLSSLTVGTHILSAQYQGFNPEAVDGYNASTSNAATTDVSKAGTSTILVVAPNPSVYGQPILASITVSVTDPGAGVPTGTVEILDGTREVGEGTLTDGKVDITLSALRSGSRSLTAVYQGDANFVKSTSTVTAQTVAAADTTTTVKIVNPTDMSPLTSSIYGQTILVSATVAPVAPGGGTVRGVVEFKDGDQVLAIRHVSASGEAILSVSNLPAGDRTITATFRGTDNYNTSSATATQSVSQAATTTTVVGLPNPAAYGQRLTFVAYVSPGSDTTPAPTAAHKLANLLPFGMPGHWWRPFAGRPTGTVDFMDGTTKLGSAEVNRLGVATFSISTLDIGSHNITVVYSGDGNYTASTSASLTQVVKQATSRTTISSSANPAKVGQSFTLSATVAAGNRATSGLPAPTGTISFYDGTNLLGTGTLGANGKATLDTTFSTVGFHNLRAVYSGDTNYIGSSSMFYRQRVVASTTPAKAVKAPVAVRQGLDLSWLSPAANKSTKAVNDRALLGVLSKLPALHR